MTPRPTDLMPSVIGKYFKSLTEEQQRQFAALGDLYNRWNSKINVISRKDIDNLYVKHVLHSLAIARFTDFKPGSAILDLGTGGGFPGIPLAIMFPQARFHLVDRIGKKIKVVDDVAQKLGLANVTTQHGDVGEVKGSYDFVVSRAVMSLDALVPLVRRLISRSCRNSIPNGLICLKGGDVDGELRRAKARAIVEDVSGYFEEEFFATKKVVYIAL